MTLGTEKKTIEWLGYLMVNEKFLQDMFIRFHTIHERDRQADRQTDTRTDTA